MLKHSTDSTEYATKIVVALLRLLGRAPEGLIRRKSKEQSSGCQISTWDSCDETEYHFINRDNISLDALVAEIGLIDEMR